MRLPVPQPINEAIGQDSPDGSDRAAFWNYHELTGTSVLSDQPLLSSTDFSYVSESEYLAEKKSNGDWDIRPPKPLVSEIDSDFENDENVFFMLKEDWLAGNPKGCYILSTSDLRNLPCIQELRSEIWRIGRKNPQGDRKRLQERAPSSSRETQAMITIMERTGLTNLEELIDQVFTTGHVQTDLELPKPE